MNLFDRFIAFLQSLLSGRASDGQTAPARSAVAAGQPPKPPAPTPAPTVSYEEPTRYEIVSVLKSRGVPAAVALVLADAHIKSGFPLEMLRKLAFIESTYRPGARNDSDRPPSVGLMGIKSNVAIRVMDWNVDQAEAERRLHDPVINLAVAVKLLKSIMVNRPAARADSGVLVEMYHLGETRYLKGERDPDYMRRYRNA